MASELSRQIHSINIGEKEDGNWKSSTLKNTWDTYHLVPSSRPVVNPPEVRTMYVDVPGVDGVLDLTTSLTGGVLYKNREGSWDFVVANDYEDWTAIYHRLMNDLHGKRWLVSLQDDPYYYYKGRLSVNEWKSERNWSKITLDYYFEPYKYEFNTANEPWLWDPFSFETGIIRNYGSPESIVVDEETIMEPLVVNGDHSLTVQLHETARIVPIIVHVLEGSQNITVNFKQGTAPYTSAYPLSVGANNVTDMLISQYPNPEDCYLGNLKSRLQFSGTGTLWIEFQGGWL